MGSTVSIQRSAPKEDFPKVKLIRCDAPIHDGPEIILYPEQEVVDDWGDYVAFMNNNFNADTFPQYTSSHHT
jgi:hypothetical protein